MSQAPDEGASREELRAGTGKILARAPCAMYAIEADFDKGMVLVPLVGELLAGIGVTCICFSALLRLFV